MIPIAASLNPLTPRQTEILQLLANNIERKDIAVILGISPLTLKKTVEETQNRAGFLVGKRDITRLVAWAWQIGIIV